MVLWQVPEDEMVPGSNLTVESNIACNETRSPAKEYFKSELSHYDI